MNEYKAIISFEDEKHCMYCPFRNDEDDCTLQYTEIDDPIYIDWEAQMEHCPLVPVEPERVKYAEQIGYDFNHNELQNVAFQRLAVAPSNPVKGQVYFNTASNRLFYYNGTSWTGFDAVDEEDLVKKRKLLADMYEIAKKYIKEYGHPHMYITLDINGAEVTEGLLSYIE